MSDVAEFKRRLETGSRKFAKIGESTLNLQREICAEKRKKYERDVYHGDMVLCVKAPGKCPCKSSQQFVLAGGGEFRVFCLAVVPCWREAAK